MKDAAAKDQLLIRVPAELGRAIRALALTQGISLSSFGRTALQATVERQSGPMLPDVGEMGRLP